MIDFESTFVIHPPDEVQKCRYPTNKADIRTDGLQILSLGKQKGDIGEKGKVTESLLPPNWVHNIPEKNSITPTDRISASFASFLPLIWFSFGFFSRHFLGPDAGNHLPGCRPFSRSDRSKHT